MRTAAIGKTAGIWAPALSQDGQYLAGTTQDGHIKVWDLLGNGEQIRDHDTKGSFGTCIDLVYSNPNLRIYNLHSSLNYIILTVS